MVSGRRKGVGVDESRAEVAADPALATRFTQLLERHEAQLHAFVGGMVADRELARDIVQDTFVAAWRATSRHHAPFDDPVDEPGTRRWLYAVGPAPRPARSSPSHEPTAPLAPTLRYDHARQQA
jgi:hypothetical protein